MRYEMVKGTLLHTEFSSGFCESGKWVNVYASLLRFSMIYLQDLSGDLAFLQLSSK